ncbi:MAG TPA: hypothetical protein VEP49_14395 [Acidimicrobiia bacterium]|nr:hypothetical protein [Acidimicrobiia bacterium]
MAAAEFTEALRRLTPDDVHAIARSLESDTAGDEVDAWRATIAIDRALRHTHRTREAARAAWTAAQTVQRTAADQGIQLPDEDVTHVARAAAEVARGLVAADGVESEVSRLLLHWFPLVVQGRAY